MFPLYSISRNSIQQQIQSILLRRPAPVFLQLTSRKMGTEIAKEVIPTIGMAKCVQFLQLADNQLTDEVMPLIIELISKPDSPLKTLDLSMNSFTDNGAEILLNALTTLKEKESLSLQSLSLAINTVSPRLIAAINTVITSPKNTTVPTPQPRRGIH